jgi:hypothetical protein
MNSAMHEEAQTRPYNSRQSRSRVGAGLQHPECNLNPGIDPPLLR